MPKKINYTSGEKRGLIAILFILIILFVSMFIFRNYGKEDSITINVQEPNTIMKEGVENPAKDIKQKNYSKKKQKSTKEKPSEGIKRNYREEYID